MIGILAYSPLIFDPGAKTERLLDRRVSITLSEHHRQAALRLADHATDLLKVRELIAGHEGIQ